MILQFMIFFILCILYLASHSLHLSKMDLTDHNTDRTADTFQQHCMITYSQKKCIHPMPNSCYRILPSV